MFNNHSYVFVTAKVLVPGGRTPATTIGFITFVYIGHSRISYARLSFLFIFNSVQNRMNCSWLVIILGCMLWKNRDAHKPQIKGRKHIRKKFCTVGMVGHWHTSCPDKLWMSHPSKCSRPGWIILLKSEGQNYHNTKINVLCYVKFGIYCMTAVRFWLFVLGLLFKIYFILVVLNFGLNYTNENLEKHYWKFRCSETIHLTLRSGDVVTIILVILLALQVCNMLS